MKTKLFGSVNDPRDQKDEVEHYCITCGMEEVEEKGGSCEECKEKYCRCGKPLKDETPLCKLCLL